MKPIIFKIDRVFRAFRTEGGIATFRKTYPNEPELWVRRSRTGEKEFEATVEKVVRVGKGETMPFSTASSEKPTGFDNTNEWLRRIRNMYNGVIPSGWIIYLQKKQGEKE